MKQVVRGLLLSALAISSAGAKIYGDRTFMNHRDELSDAALNWAGDNHYTVAADDNNLGATVMVTPFYSKTTNHEDIAKLFGQGTTGKIAVAKSTVDKTGDFEGSDVEHSPTSDYANSADLPMYGTVSLKPEREAYGARLSWRQSLDSLLAGLSLNIDTPLVQVNTNMNMSVSGTASASPASSGGAGKGLADYFGGTLTKATDGTNVHAKQAALKKAKLSSTKQGKFSVGDVHVGLNWQFLNRKKFNATAGVNLVVPTGNSATGEYTFEPMAGNGGHTMLGASLGASFKAVCKKNLSVDLQAVADWRYGFEATVKRTLGVGPNTGSVADTSSHHQLGIENKQSGVFPLANVLTKDCNVTLGHQLDAVVGLSGSFRGIKFDLGYNLFAREAEKVELKDKQWTDDKYAVAHREYSVSTAALGAEFLGGVPAGVTKAGDYNDSTAPATKHQHVIGANGVAGGTPELGDAAAKTYPGGFASSGGPIQNTGKTTSGLKIQTVAVGGVSSDGTGTLTPSSHLTVVPCTTESQLTHSIFGGLSYQFKGDFPIILGVGGKVEMQGNDHNSALERWTVFGKLGMTF